MKIKKKNPMISIAFFTLLLTAGCSNTHKPLSIQEGLSNTTTGIQHDGLSPSETPPENQPNSSTPVSFPSTNASTSAPHLVPSPLSLPEPEQQNSMIIVVMAPSPSPSPNPIPTPTSSPLVLGPLTPPNTVNNGTISSGNHFSCAIRNGTLYCWGYNAFGQVGNGSASLTSNPTPVMGLLSSVTSVALGRHHACAIKNSALYCWGYNAFGQLGDGTTANRYSPTLVAGLTSGVMSVAAGGHSTCAILSSGSLKCWGENSFGQLGDGTILSRKVPTQVSGLTSNVTMVSLANEYNGLPLTHTCALHEGAAKCWGYNGFKQVRDGLYPIQNAPYALPLFSTGVTAVAAFANRTCVIQQGTLKCWGNNSFGQLGDGTTLNQSAPTVPVGLETGVTALGGGVWHQCAVKSGALYCWGRNDLGQLGIGSALAQSAPALVPGMEYGVKEVSKEGVFSTCVVRFGGTYCWGYNLLGELGNNNLLRASLQIE